MPIGVDEFRELKFTETIRRVDLTTPRQCMPTAREETWRYRLKGINGNSTVPLLARSTIQFPRFIPEREGRGLTTTKKSRRFFFIPRDPARVRFVAFDNKNLVQLPQTRSPIVAGARTSARNCLRLDSTRLDSAKVGTRTLLNNIFHGRGRNACNKREYQALTLRLHGVFFLLPPFFSLFLFFQ